MVLYELFTGKEPHYGMDILKYANKVAHEGYRPPLEDQSNSGIVIPQEWRELIKECWDSNPDRRPAFAQIIERLPALTNPKTPPSSPSKPILGVADAGYIC